MVVEVCVIFQINKEFSYFYFFLFPTFIFLSEEKLGSKKCGEKSRDITILRDGK